jgi:hypothetical protein
MILEDYQRLHKQSTWWGCGAVFKLFVAVLSTPVVELGNQVIMSVLEVVCGWCAAGLQAGTRVVGQGCREIRDALLFCGPRLWCGWCLFFLGLLSTSAHVFGVLRIPVRGYAVGGVACGKVHMIRG